MSMSPHGRCCSEGRRLPCVSIAHSPMACRGGRVPPHLLSATGRARFRFSREERREQRGTTRPPYPNPSHPENAAVDAGTPNQQQVVHTDNALEGGALGATEGAGEGTGADAQISMAGHAPPRMRKTCDISVMMFGLGDRAKNGQLQRRGKDRSPKGSGSHTITGLYSPCRHPLLCHPLRPRPRGGIRTPDDDRLSRRRRPWVTLIIQTLEEPIQRCVLG